MLYRAIPLLLAAPLLCLPADDVVRGSNENIQIEAKVYNGKEAVKSVVGNDLDGFICIVELKVIPLTDKPIAISRDDFTLLSNKDGQKSGPFVPSQIAGQGAMVVKQRDMGYGILGQSDGPVYGGMGGPMGGMGVGTSTTTQTTNEVSMDKGDNKKLPLLDLLKTKQMPEKTTADPVSGLLYFPLEGKHKTKDLELIYKGPAGKVSVRFQ